MYQLHESSIAAGLISEGDRLMAIDDRDVGSMEIDQVSKIIELKSGNPIRKMTLLRSTAQC